ncbi:PepSY-associated TM helix domain-containing protein [Zavarzinia sp.]|uniref:PepSY-associated TM helix domain-containing protein n=1 Tax=Zavarzinia sp. TaxID=2027920 RepID=UPI003565A201
MTTRTRGRLRRLLQEFHLWLGVGLALLTVPLGLTGSALVWHDGIDRLLSPERYAVSGAGPGLAALAETALDTLGDGARLTQIRLPEDETSPITMVARPAGAANPRETVAVWLDPATGKVLDSGPANNGFMRLMHDFHGNLLVPAFSGRQIVGWLGVALLILSLTGIYLWWPKRLSLLRAFGWRPRMLPSANLHHVFGIWIAIPLALLSFTGIYLSFPQTARLAVGSITTVSPPGQRGPGGFGGQPLTATVQTPDAALQAALAAAPEGAVPRSLSLPTEQNPSWRITFATVEGAMATVGVDDASGATKAAPPPAATPGDLFGRWMRRLHDGTGMGLIFQTIIFVAGILPTLFAVTGTMMWLRRRRATRAMAARRAAAMADSAS